MRRVRASALALSVLTAPHRVTHSVGGVSVAGDSVQSASQMLGQVVVDSGTTALILAPAAYAAMRGALTTNYAYLPGLQQVLANPTGTFVNMSLAQRDTWPTLDIVVGSVVLAVPPVNYFLCSAVSNVCAWLIGTVSGASGVPTTILGDVVMQGYEVTFDRVNQRVGFAPVGDCAGTGEEGAEKGALRGGEEGRG